MPSPCLHCNRAIHKPCDCYLWPSSSNWRSAPSLSDTEYLEFRRQRARLGRDLDEAADERNRAEQALAKAREKELELQHAFESDAQFANNRLLRTVIEIPELRDAVLAPLLPGEVLAFLAGCGLRMDKHIMSHDLSPLKVVLPAGIWLRRRLRQGYNLTLISGTRDMLLFGLLGLEFNPWDLPLKKGRCYSALLIATKDGRFVSCSSEFLPLGEFGGVDRQPDSLRDHFSEDGTARTVDMMYGKDRMSIWMPLTEQSIFSPLNVPQPVFRSVCRNTYQKIFYSHLQDADSSIRGPLSHAEAHYKLPWHISQEPTFTIDVLSTDNKRTSSNRTTSYHIEPPIDKS